MQKQWPLQISLLIASVHCLCSLIVYILHLVCNGTHLNVNIFVFILNNVNSFVFIMNNMNIFVFFILYFIFCIYCAHSSRLCYTVALEEQNFNSLYVLHKLWIDNKGWLALTNNVHCQLSIKQDCGSWMILSIYSHHVPSKMYFVLSPFFLVCLSLFEATCKRLSCSPYFSCHLPLLNTLLFVRRCNQQR